MSESSINAHRTTASSCLIYLQFAMAGDMESIDMLSQLHTRLQSICWDDPAFIEFSNQMLGDRRLSPFAADEDPSLQLRSVVNFVMLHHAEQSEYMAQMRAAAGELSQLMETREKVTQSIIDTSKQVRCQNTKLRERLEMLGADMSEFPDPLEET